MSGSQGGAQISKRVRIEYSDKAKVLGSMDRHINRWRVHTLASHVSGQVDTRGKPGVVKVVSNVEAIRSKIDAVVPKVMVDQDQVKLARVKQHGLGHTDSLDRMWDGGGSSIGLEMEPDGPPAGLEKDPIANVVGQQLGLGQDAMQADEENRFEDPVIYEVNSVLNASLTCSGPRVGREVGLGSQVDQSKSGLDPKVVDGLGVIDVPSHVDFSDISVQPDVIPPAGFAWKFSEGMWAPFSYGEWTEGCLE